MIVNRALEKDPARRYQSATEMAQDLSAALFTLSAPPLAPSRSERWSRRPVVAVVVVTVVILASALAAGTWLYARSARRAWVREEAIPQIAALRREDKPLAAFLLLRRAESALPGDAGLAAIAKDLTFAGTITSSPSGAAVEIQDYLAPDAPWWTIGTNPLKKVRLPHGYFRWRVSRTASGTCEVGGTSTPSRHVSFEDMARAPHGMVPVNGGPWAEMVGFLGWLGPYIFLRMTSTGSRSRTGAFRHSWTRAGTRSALLEEPFVRDGRTLGWKEAMARFRD